MKKKVLGWLIAICLLTMVIVLPIGGTFASDDLGAEDEVDTAALDDLMDALDDVMSDLEAGEPDEEPVEEPEEEPTEEPVEEPEEPTEEPEIPDVDPDDVPVIGGDDEEDEPEDEPELPTVPDEDEPEIPEDIPNLPLDPFPDDDEPELPEIGEDEEVDYESDVAVNAYANIGSLFVGEGSVMISADVSGSYAPFTVTLTVTNKGNEVYEETLEDCGEGTYLFNYEPQRGGDHRFKVTVRDDVGEKVSETVRVLVAVHDREYENEWEASVEGVELTGNWREDIVAIASTQIGYSESASDFLVDEEGIQRGYTRYGAWYGDAYGEWCATFISFCLNYAEISENDFPREAHVGKWRNALDKLGAYEDDEDSYLPKMGDLVFFSWEGETLDHVGIVEKVKGGSVYTIEGNSAGMVRRQQYDLGDRSIVGYANMSTMMARAGVEETEIEIEIVSTKVELPEGCEKGYTAHDSVNLRSRPSIASRRLTKLYDRGTEVSVLGAEAVDGQIWYFVGYGDHIGYIRGDLLLLTGIVETGKSDVVLGLEQDATLELPEEPVLPEIADLFAGLDVELEGLFGEAGAAAACVCGALPDENGQIEHLAGCALYEMEEIVCSCGAQPDAMGNVLHAEDCPLHIDTSLNAQATVCTCGAAADEFGMVVHSADCALLVTVCACYDEDGVRLCERDCDCVCHVEAAIAHSAEIAAWIEETNPTPLMIARAMEASSLDSLMLEEAALVYVRTGEIVANYNEETNAITDLETDAVIGFIINEVVYMPSK